MRDDGVDDPVVFEVDDEIGIDPVADRRVTDRTETLLGFPEVLHDTFLGDAGGRAGDR